MSKSTRRRRVRRTKGDEDPIIETVPKQSKEEAFREEYAYVLQDLRRVFILALLMFALLIGLNLILQ